MTKKERGATIEDALEREVIHLCGGQENLGGLIRGFLDSDRGSKLAADDISTIENSLVLGDAIRALTIISGLVPAGSVPRDPDKPIRELRRDLRQILSQEEGQIPIRSGSHTLKLGKVYHAIGGESEISFSRTGSLQLHQDNIRLGYAGQTTIVEALVIERKTAPVQASFLNPQPDQTPVIISLEEPLVGPIEGTSLEEWAMNIIRTSLMELKKGGWLPRKPFDVAQALRNGESRRLLISAIEAAHVLIGDRAGISFIAKAQDGKTGRISVENMQEFSVLNMLAWLESVINLRRDPREGLLNELSTGDLVLAYLDENGEQQAIPIKGGVLDLVRFNWTEEGDSPDLPQGHRQLTVFFEGESQSQTRRHWRYASGENGKPDHRTVTRTQLGRSILSYFKLLFRQNGETFLERLRTEIDDFKYQAGDAEDWDRVFIRENLPDPKHMHKMEDYLFLTVAQLYCAWLWYKGKGENLAVVVDEVVDFAREHRLLDGDKDQRRLKGRNRYLLPDGEEVCEVELADPYDDLKAIGERIIGDRLISQSKASVLQALRTLSLISAHRRNSFEIVHQEPTIPELPEKVEELFFRYDHHCQLSLAELTDALFDRAEFEERVTLKKAVYFKEGNVFVLWLKGLVGEERELRLALNFRNGEFALVGLEDCILRGHLVSKREMRGVKERPEQLKEDFIRDIWWRLEGGEETESTETWADEEFEFDDKGVKRTVVRGKPRIYNLDLMTGILELDWAKLKAAVEAHGDEFDLERIARAAKAAREGSDRTVNVFCPITYHGNRRHEAAAVFGGDDPNLGCFGCHRNIRLRTTRRPFEFTARTSGLAAEDFCQVSLQRHWTFSTLLEIASSFAAAYPEGERYLLQRGLSPEDIGKFGYLPLELAGLITDLVESADFKEMVKGKYGRALRLDDALKLSAQSGRYSEAAILIDQIIPWIEKLPDPEFVIRRLTFGALKDMDQRGVFGRTGEGWLKTGGRILFPGWWWQGARLKIGGCYMRGVSLEGNDLFQGKRHIKTFTPKTRREIGGKRLRNLPAGFGLKDPEAFLLHSRNGVVILEGALTAASFARFRPDLQYQLLVNLGTGYQSTIAFLRQLGMRGDKSGHSGLGIGVEKIWIATDFDQGGVDAFYRLRQQIAGQFPGVRIATVHELLPDIVIRSLPEIFRNGLPPDDRETLEGIFGESGPLHGRTLDMNDLLLTPGVREKHAYTGLPF